MSCSCKVGQSGTCKHVCVVIYCYICCIVILREFYSGFTLFFNSMTGLQVGKMANTWSEDEIGRKWDRCFTDAALKLGGGILIGSVFSLLFFRRKWPVIIGASFGLGMAYTNCENDINASVSQCKSKIRCEEPKK